MSHSRMANPSKPNDQSKPTQRQGLKTQRHPTWFFTKRGLRYVGGYLLITNCDLSTTCLTPRVWHVTLSDGQSKQTQQPIQANPTTTARTANPTQPTRLWNPNGQPNDMANPTMAIQQRPTGQLLPNQRRPIHQRRPTQQEASGKILRGLPSHHSSALSPLYATPTCPHCSHY